MRETRGQAIAELISDMRKDKATDMGEYALLIRSLELMREQQG